jgi:hypothetical protein
MCVLTRGAGLVAIAGLLVLERFGRRSGASRGESRSALPGDELVARPLWASTRAITIDAPPERVWPWVVQMGFPPHRAGWYTPHWLDVAMWGERPRSADHIVAELQDLQVGDKVPDSADYSIYYDVEAVVPPGAAAPGVPAHIVLHSGRHVFGPIKESDFTWVFALRRTFAPATGAAQTRLLVRARVAYRPLWAVPLIEITLNAGDLVNVSFMLRNIRRLAEAGG